MPDGSIQKYKARRVVKGYNQVQGFNFQETFFSSCETFHCQSHSLISRF